MIGPFIPGRALWAEIDLDAIAANFRAVQGMVGPEVTVWAALKGNAYGNGAAAVGQRLGRVGAQAFAVGDIADALALRRAGLRQPILLYPNCFPEAADTVRDHALTLTLCSTAEAAAWARALATPVDAFIKVDVGAARAGVLPDEAGELAACIAAQGCFRLRGLYAHLNLPDPARMHDHARRQFAHFRQAETAVEARGLAAPVRMVSGSAALLGHPEMDLNAVDPGRVLYGIGFSGTPRQPALRPALHALRARLLLVKRITPDLLGGVEPPFAMTDAMCLGLIPVGFADRFPRPAPPGTVVLVRGRRVPVLGPTHFEHLRIDLTAVEDAAYGDVVTLIGADGEAAIGLDEAAAMWGTSVLELYAGLRRDLPRHDIGSGDENA